MEKHGSMFIKNTKYKILTPDGFKTFDGIRRKYENVIRFNFSNGEYLDVTKDHLFGDKLAGNLKSGDIIESINGPVEVINIEDTNTIKDVYDPIDVDGNLYIGNDIVNHNCEFLGSSKTVIDPKVLETLIDNYKTPILRELEDNLLIYEKPEAGKKYVLGCDIGKGTGEHDSTIQVLELVSMVPVKLKQVAVFKDNMTDVYNFSKIIDRVCNYYNKAYIMVENNAEGASVVNELWWNIENDRLVNTGSKVANLGVRATRSTKPRAVLLMKKLIEDYSLELVDENTIAQLTSFIEKGNKFYGENMPDDLVSGLYWACYILEMGILDESFEFSDDKKMKEDDGWGILTDADMNIEDDWSWMNNNTFSN